MEGSWGEIILGIISFLGVVWGGWTTFYLRKEQKRSAQLDNDNKVAQSWRELYEESQNELERERERNLKQQNYIDDLHKDKSRLQERSDSLSTKCAVSELLICKELNCPKRNPPLGSKIFADEFARQVEKDRASGENGDDDEHDAADIDEQEQTEDDSDIRQPERLNP